MTSLLKSKKDKENKRKIEIDKNEKKNLEIKKDLISIFDENEDFGSKSWQKYCNETCPELFDNFLNVRDFINLTKKKIKKDELDTKQEYNKKISDIFTKSFIDLKQSNQINGWNYQRTKNVISWRDQLEYSYTVNYYFMFHLKKRESGWSWILIVISSFCSVLTIIQTDIAILQFIVNYGLSLLAIMTSLIAAYVKKENYVERIKNMDRYTQKVGQVCTELTSIMNSKPWNRMEYSSFIDKYKEQITSLFSFPPPISPKEFKETVYKLTIYHPELIRETFPWFKKVKVGKIELYEMTDWGEKILKSYKQQKYNRCLYRIFCCYCCSYNRNDFLDPSEYNNQKLKEMLNEREIKIETLKKHSRVVSHENQETFNYNNHGKELFKKTGREIELTSNVVNTIKEYAVDEEELMKNQEKEQGKENKEEINIEINDE